MRKRGMKRSISLAVRLAFFLSIVLSVTASVQALGQQAAPGAGAQGPGGQGGARGGRGGGRGAPAVPATGQSSATVDLTGYWVSLVTEDWKWRMKVPEKGDVSSIPVSQAARDAADAWDPAKDEAEGNACRGYGAAAIMRVPTRVHVSWDSSNILKLETDAGTQTRLFRFNEAVETAPSDRSWQGTSVAEWEPTPGGRGGGRGGPGAIPGGPGGGGPGGGGPGAGPGGFPAGPPPGGAAPAGNNVPPPPAGGPPAGGRGGRGPSTAGNLKIVTTNLKAGYLRKNGVPYGEKAVVTEYFQRTPETYGRTYMIVTTIVEDPEFLTGPFITSSHFEKLPDTNNGWDPSPCSVR